MKYYKIMMLKSYFDQFPLRERKKEKERIARAVGVSVYALQHWINGRRNPAPLHAIALEKNLNRFLTRQELRPDIYPPDEQAA